MGDTSFLSKFSSLIKGSPVSFRPDPFFTVVQSAAHPARASSVRFNNHIVASEIHVLGNSELPFHDASCSGIVCKVESHRNDVQPRTHCDDRIHAFGHSLCAHSHGMGGYLD